MPRPRASAWPMRDSFSLQASATSSSLRKDSIATNGWPAAIEELGSLSFILSGQAAKRFLGIFNVLHGQLARFDQPGDDRFDAPSKETEKVIDQAISGNGMRHDRLKNIRIADLLCDANGFLRFQSINNRLHCCECRTFLLGKCIQDF